ncbi:MAG: hypothetical protein [Microvirus sp.]|nr:MAG: hypothetical protein [Microvirus sp.]
MSMNSVVMVQLTVVLPNQKPVIALYSMDSWSNVLTQITKANEIGAMAIIVEYVNQLIKENEESI